MALPPRCTWMRPRPPAQLTGALVGRIGVTADLADRLAAAPIDLHPAQPPAAGAWPLGDRPGEAGHTDPLAVTTRMFQEPLAATPRAARRDHPGRAGAGEAVDEPGDVGRR